MSGNYILMLGCFDTKGDVFDFLRKRILEQGEQVISINTGVLGTTALFPVDYESDAVALKAGTSLAELRKERDRGQAIELMGKGAANIVAELVAGGKIKAAIGMGGGGGTYITLFAMQEIPLGIPKICLTTLATKDLSRQIGNKDITLIPSIVDVAGVNSISNTLMAQAAAAICAMSRVIPPARQALAGSIAISMFGNTTACVDHCTMLLEKKGYEVLAFHATGVGGRAMEALIREGCFDGVLDITTTELADDLCGGICSAGPERMHAASEMGIPQVVVPGCLDMVNFGHLDTVPGQFKSRQLYSWAPDVTLMRTNEIENGILAERLVSKLARSKAESVIFLPVKGVSQIDAEDGIFYKPEVDRILFDTIIELAPEEIQVIEADLHINDPEFAEMLVTRLTEMLDRAKNGALNDIR